MTQKQATKVEATILYKVTVKRNGITVYHVQGTESVYYVTLSSRGTISSCVDEHDNTCKGFLYNHGACKHAKAVQAREDERKQQEPYAARLHNGCDLDRYNAAVESQYAPITDVSQKGVLSSASGKEFSLLR